MRVRDIFQKLVGDRFYGGYQEIRMQEIRESGDQEKELYETFH